MLSRGKALAHSTACRNQLRQIALVLSVYVSDQGRYPSVVGKGTNTWADRLYPSTPRHWTNLSWHCPAYIARKGVVSAGIAGVAAELWTSYAYNGTGIFDGPWDSDKFQLGLGTRPRYAKSEPEVLVPSAMYTAGRCAHNWRTTRNIRLLHHATLRAAAPSRNRSSAWARL